MRATRHHASSGPSPRLSGAPWTPLTSAPADGAPESGGRARAALLAGLASLLLPIPIIAVAFAAGLWAFGVVGLFLPIPLAGLAAVLASAALRGPVPDDAHRGTAIAGVVLGIVGVTVWSGVLLTVAAFLQAAGPD